MNELIEKYEIAKTNPYMDQRIVSNLRSRIEALLPIMPPHLRIRYFRISS